MQHKHYFAALLCGALCLTGCLKNEESASVASVRNAKANELNASAELLKAQAAAETVLANADAAIKQAQAKLTEANAKKVEAEAEYQKVLNELKAVEVELQKVKVEEEKVELLKKQAELEAILAQLEVVKAQAEKELANIAKELQKIQSEMEVDAVKQALALLEAENEMQEYLDGLEAAEQEEFQQVIAMYFHLQSAILEAQVQIFQNEITIAKMDADAEAAYEEISNQIKDATAKQSRLDAVIEKAKEYLDYDSEALEDERTSVRIALIDAQNDLLEAEIALSDHIYGDYADASTAMQNTYYYDYQSYYSDSEGLYVYLRDIAGVNLKYVQHDEDDYNTWGYQWGYYDEDSEWVPVHNQQYTHYILQYHNPTDEEVAELEEKGIKVPNTAIADYHYEIVPAQTDVEAVEAVIDAYVAEQKADIDEKKAAAAEKAEVLEKSYQSTLDNINAQIAATKAYVEEVGPKFEAADQAVEDAWDAFQAAVTAYNDAWNAYDLARINNAELEEAIAAKFTADENYNDAFNAYATAKADSTEAVKNVKKAKRQFTLYYNGARSIEDEDVATAEYNRDLAIAEKTAEVNTKQAAVTAAIKTAYENAKTATATAKTALKTAEGNVTTTLAALRAAEIALAADPTNTALQTAKNTAQTNYNNAENSLTTAETNLATAVAAEATAKAAFDTVNNPYETAQAELDALKAKKAQWEERFDEVEGAYAEAKAAAEEALNALNEAEADKDAAEEALEDAEEELASDEWDALQEAGDAWNEAIASYFDAQDAVDKLENTYRHYRQDADAIYEAESEDETDGWLIDNQKYYADALENLIADYDEDGDYESYEDYIAGLDEQFDAIETVAKEMKAMVEKYDTQYRPAYVEAVEAMNEADLTYNELSFAVEDAQAIVDILEAYYEMLNVCVFYDEEGNLRSVEEYIATLKAEEQEIIDEINELIEIYNEGVIEADILRARLTLQNQQLQACIDIWTIQLDQYQKIINEWLAAHAPVEE